jgi:hypothetical protein
MDVAPDAFRVVMALSAPRLEGHEHDRRRPSLLLRLSGGDAYLVEIRPKLDSLPTGWQLNPLVPLKLVSRSDGNTELIARLRSDGTLKLSQWKRDDARNEQGCSILRDALEQFANDPRRAWTWSADRCALCGKGLTDPQSRERGIGPECRAAAD